jgi:hypothetical protein
MSDDPAVVEHVGVVGETHNGLHDMFDQLQHAGEADFRANVSVTSPEIRIEFIVLNYNML